MESATGRSFWKPAILAGMLTAISLLHYLTGTHHSLYHDIYIRLYYFPIILASFWYGLRGGVGTALLASLLYLPHLLMQWPGGIPNYPHKALEVGLFNVIGLVSGYLVRQERILFRRLTDSYRALRAKTDRVRELEIELIQRDRLAVLGELSAALAHEIRTPLSSIKGAAEILSDPKTPAADRDEFYRILQRESAQLDRVVGRTLDFARLPEPRLEEVRPWELFESVRELLGSRARKVGAELRIEAVSEGTTLRLDPGLMQQVLINLVLNSIAAADGPGCVISLGHREIEGGHLLLVEDNGRGINDDDLPKLTKNFFTTRPDGVGLGLSIVKRMVEAHRGRLGLKKRREGGTRVEIFLPADPGGEP